MAFLAELEQAGAEPPRRPAPPPGDWPPGPPVTGVIPIGQVECRQRVLVQGTVVHAGPHDWQGGTVFECVIDDGTGAIALALVGRRAFPGLAAGAPVLAEGVAGERRGRLVILNPQLTLLRPEAR